MTDVSTVDPPSPPTELPSEPPAPEALPTTSITKIAGAIAAVMAEVSPIEKRGYNKFHGYKFVQMGDVLAELTPLLAKHGLMVMQTERGRSMFDDDRTIAIQYEFTIAHTSGEVWPQRIRQTGMSACRNTKGGFDDKSINKCHTAARKYFLMALFQIPSGDVDDADRDGRQQRKPVAAQNVMAPPPDHDPETGEVYEPPADAMSNASIEDQARKAANGGQEVFGRFYRRLSEDNKLRVQAIGDELREMLGPKPQQEQSQE